MQLKKRTGGRRRKFEITIKKVSADSSDKGDGYDDGFNFDVTDVTSERSRIAKIHTVRKILQTDFLDGNDISSDNPAIFEVEPKESIDLDIYNEVGSAMPIVENWIKSNRHRYSKQTLYYTMFMTPEEDNTVILRSKYNR